MTLRDLDRSHKFASLNILCAAFHDYPVMRYVIGEADPEYDGKLRELIDLFVEARLTRNIPLIGLHEANDFRGIAVVSPPKEISMPPKLAECHAQVERRLGREAMARLDRYNEACEATDPGHVAHYLGSGRSPCNYDQDRARSSGISQRKSKDVFRRRRRAAPASMRSRRIIMRPRSFRRPH